jgi:hypothetical protein
MKNVSQMNEMNIIYLVRFKSENGYFTVAAFKIKEDADYYAKSIQEKYKQMNAKVFVKKHKN